MCGTHTFDYRPTYQPRHPYITRSVLIKTILIAVPPVNAQALSKLLEARSAWTRQRLQSAPGAEDGSAAVAALLSKLASAVQNVVAQVCASTARAVLGSWPGLQRSEET